MYTLALVLVYIALFLCSHTVRHYTKIIIPHTVLTVAAILTLPIAVLNLRHERNLRIFSAVVDFMRQASDIRWELRGTQHLKMDGSAILVGNHQSALDGIGCGHYWHLVSPCTVVSKQTLLYMGPMGLVLYLGNTVFIDRTNTQEAREILDAQIKTRIARKAKIMLYPEGTRNYSGDTLLPFKKGAFHLAIKFQLPIIPVVYSSQKSYYDVKTKFWHNKKLIITALPSISTTGMTSDNVDELTTSVREIMLKTFLESSNENGNSQIETK